jgi:uncharacterized protein (DUF4415 family)
MEFTWSKSKRAANLKAHGLDFVDAPIVFEGLTFTLKMIGFPTASDALSLWDSSLAFRFPSSIRRASMKSASSHSAKPRNVKRKSTSTKSKTDWARLESKNSGAPTREHPEADIRHIVHGMVRRGLQSMPSKAAVSLRVDQDVLEWFKAQGPGYQTRINSVLRAFRDASV